MGKTETLQRIKEAEAKVLAMKREAEAECERILKQARRAELELHEAMSKDAEARCNKVIADAKSAVSREREAILDKGRREAKRIREEGMSNFNKSVEWLVGDFKGALDA